MIWEERGFEAAVAAPWKQVLRLGLSALAQNDGGESTVISECAGGTPAFPTRSWRQAPPPLRGTGPFAGGELLG